MTRPITSRPAKTARIRGEKPPGTTLWLIRHAEVEPRYHSIFGGRIDMELSSFGHWQAAALAEYLKNKHFDAVYASPMRRVQQTLAPLVRPGFPQPTSLSELREVDFGAWTGLSWEQVRAKFGVSPFTWLDQLEHNRIPNAESGPLFRARLEPCIQSILKSHPGRQVAILCHGGVVRMLLSIILEWKFTLMGAVEVEYASITQVSIGPDRTRLQLLNFTPWRDLGNGAPPHAGPEPVQRSD